MSRVQEWRTMGERVVVAHVLFDNGRHQCTFSNGSFPIEPYLLQIVLRIQGRVVWLAISFLVPWYIEKKKGQRTNVLASVGTKYD